MMVTDEYKGFKCIRYEVEGRESILVCPDEALPGKPWVWRAEFLGAFDYADMALVRKGWHLAYHRVSDLYGCPASLEMMKRFYDFTVRTFALGSQAVLFGFSRGGLYAAGFAHAYPECVSMLYLDAPVTDICSWPGGLGTGVGSPKEWDDCMWLYHLTPETVLNFKSNPNDFAEDIARSGIPVILVAGDADTIVPFSENGAVFAERYGRISNQIRIILKPGCEHHPHSLADPSSIVAFIEEFYTNGPVPPESRGFLTDARSGPSFSPR